MKKWGTLLRQEKGGGVARQELVINGRGETKAVYPVERTHFADKKIPVVDEEHLLSQLVQARRVYREMEVGQREGTVEIRPQYPDLPVYLWLNTDSHIGSVLTDYEAFLRDYRRVLETPNFYAI